MKPMTSAATAQRTQRAPNQSSSWPFVEDDLQAAGPNDKETEANVVEGANFGVLDVGRIVNEAGDHEDGEDADGNVDVEGVAPAEGVGEPAAQRWAEDRGDDDSEAVCGHATSIASPAESFRAGWIAKAAAERRRRLPA